MTITIQHPHAPWSVKVPTPAYEAALPKVLAGAKHHEVFETLRDHGTPVRGGGRGKYPASQAATALMSRHAEGLLDPRPRFTKAFDALRGYRLTRSEAEDLVCKVLAPCVAGTGVKILLVDEDKHAANRSGTSSEAREPGFYWVLPIFDVDGDADSWHQKHQPAYWDGTIWHMLGVEDEAWQPKWVGERIAPMDGTSERAPGA